MSAAQPALWAGVDVGGRRKGFHAAVVDWERLLEAPRVLHGANEVVRWALRWAPRVVAIDSPRTPAPDGQRSREGERQLARSVCGIRYTPDQAALEANRTYYEWIAQGLALYNALKGANLLVVECFPTASWTRWYAPRAGQSRGRWSARALATLEIRDLPSRLNQDERDAIGAAVTAREVEAGRCERFGDIVVPAQRHGKGGAS